MIKKRLVVFVLIIALIGVLGIRSVGASTSNSVPDHPDVVTTNIIILDTENPALTQNLKTGVFGVVTELGSDFYTNYVGIAVDSRGNSIIKTDLMIFTTKDVSSLKISQGVLIKVDHNKVELWFAHNEKIVAVPWQGVSMWSPATKRFDTQELVFGKILSVKKTGAWESEKNYCSHPVVVKKWYYIDIDVATEANLHSVTMKIEVKVPDSELKEVLNSEGSYLWLSPHRPLNIYILQQSH